MGFLAFCVDRALELLNKWKFSAVSHVVSTRGGFWAPYLTLASICMAYGLLSALLVAYGSPLAAGSGIPETKTYLNGVHIKGLVPILLQLHTLALHTPRHSLGIAASGVDAWIACDLRGIMDSYWQMLSFVQGRLQACHSTCN